IIAVARDRALCVEAPVAAGRVDRPAGGRLRADEDPGAAHAEEPRWRAAQRGVEDLERIVGIVGAREARHPLTAAIVAAGGALVPGCLDGIRGIARAVREETPPGPRGFWRGRPRARDAEDPFVVSEAAKDAGAHARPQEAEPTLARAPARPSGLLG